MASRSTPPISRVEAGRVAAEIVEGFYEGSLNLADRDVPGGGSWAVMPEVAAATALRRKGAPEQAVRSFLTFVSAMDRARDANRLWRAGTALFEERPEVFDPSVASSMAPARLKAVLSASSVSQRHGPDAAAWRTVAASLHQGRGPVPVAVIDGIGNAGELLRDLRGRDRMGRPRFPMLRGPKIGPMWVRMMANPGGASIDQLEVVPVAVDVHVRRVTEYLGVVDVGDPQGSGARRTIQAAWKDAVVAGGVGGPLGTAGTCAALDPALWFFGKYGCSHCERASRRLPISGACRGCRLGDREG